MNQNNYFDSLSDAVAASAQDVWFGFIGIIPNLIAAIIIFFVGWWVASALGRLVSKLVSRTRVDSLIDKSGLEGTLNTGSISIASVVGWVVKWFLIVIVLLAIADILNLPQITVFLSQILLYIPNVIVSVVILAAGSMLAKAADGIISRMLGPSTLPQNQKIMLGKVARYAIIVFTIMAALVQLNIVPELITILFAGLVLALALAFGLGGKDHASRWLERMQAKR